MTNVVDINRGRRTPASIAYGCVAIGDGAIANKRNEISINATGFSGSTIMTDEESRVVRNILRRLIHTNYS